MTLCGLKFLARHVIGSADRQEPLLIRYILFRCAAWGLYLHKFVRSDYDRALHDHPWPFVAIVLTGGYFEQHDQTNDGREVIEWRGPGSVLVRPAQWRHKVSLPLLGKHQQPIPSWSLCIVGRRCRRWGFIIKERIYSRQSGITEQSRWCWWRQYNPATGICEDAPLWTGGDD